MKPLVFRGGTVVDGTGARGRPADLRVEGRRIAFLGAPGSVPEQGADVVDAAGKVLAPGFIDLHSHGDLIFALEDPEKVRTLVEGRVTQGITTEIVGNCGLGPAPLSGVHEEALRATLAWATPERIEWPWEGIGGYLERLERLGVPLNVGTLVAHGAVRIKEAGLARFLPAARSPAAMREEIRKALGEGAFGLSLGLIYPPGSFTPTEEILPLAGAVAGAGGLVTAHVRGSSETLLDAVGELLEIGRRSGARVHHSHSEAVGPDHWAKIRRVLVMEEEARREGVQVSYDMFPYTAAATTMAAIYPPWSLEGGIPALLDRLRDGAARRRIRESIESVRPVWPPWGEDGWAHNLVGAVGWERITVGSTGGAASRSAEGLDLASLGRRAGVHPFEAVSDLLLAEEGNVSQIIHGISGEPGHDEGLAELVRDPAGAICTDANDTGRGRPHPAAWGAFPAILGEWVRERRALSIEEAVRKMSSLPARLLGLDDRGVLREGAAADIVVFDPLRVGSRATWREPRVRADGIHHVLVNGSFAVRDGAYLGGMAGDVLRRR